MHWGSHSVVFSDCLVSISISRSSMSFQDLIDHFISLLNSITLYASTKVIELFIYLPNKAAIPFLFRFFCRHMFSGQLSEYLGAQVLDCMVKKICSIIRNSHTVSQNCHIIFHSHQQKMRAPNTESWSAIGIASYIFCLFVLNISHTSRCVVVSHYCFNLQFLKGK